VRLSAAQCSARQRHLACRSARQRPGRPRGAVLCPRALAPPAPPARSVSSLTLRRRRDGKYPGHVRYKGPIEGRKGNWLGLEMDETIGDNDGTMGGKRYFQTHDGQGMFIREESGRAEAVQKANSSVSKEMLEHLRFLFDSFDSDESGGIDEDELYQAMRNLGQRATRRHVRHIFNEIVRHRSAGPPGASPLTASLLLAQDLDGSGVCACHGHLLSRAGAGVELATASFTTFPSHRR